MSTGQRGFTYIGILIAVVLLGIASSAAATLWSFAARREKEAELLFVGHQFRRAIAQYYAAPGAAFQYPRELSDLLDDNRTPQPRHFLRRIYRDPMTGKADWQLIRTADGAIAGVASSSLESPVKRSNFTYADAAFDKATCYCDWQFLYEPRHDRARQLK